MDPNRVEFVARFKVRRSGSFRCGGREHIWIIRSLDNESKLIGVSRQSLIKLWISERLQEERRTRAEQARSPVTCNVRLQLEE
ncbi:MAG: hypothetical protein EA427_02255 [Spirochaetaceae bacterium]|nr:MAG: hypothetical protein EA427_02255 [Spirochaetaceae bacterium]